MKINKNKVIQNSFLFFLFFHCSYFSFAQNFGNEWINYSQPYYKISVTQTGVYRITYNNLLTVGLGGVNPKNLQLFHRGIEQAILVAGENDNVLDPADYVEFYGVRNDATQDYELYKTPNLLVNPYYNLYSDTTAYFLTVKTGATNNKRIQQVNEPFASPLAPFHWNEEIQFFSEQFANGQNYPVSSNEDLYESAFDAGEGWASTVLNAGNSRTLTFPVSNVYTLGGPSVRPRLEVVVIGDALTSYRVDVRVGNSAGTLRLLNSVGTNFKQKAVLVQDIEISDINGTGQFLVQLTSAVSNARIVYIRLLYPQGYTMDGSNNKNFNLPANPTGVSYLEVINPPANAVVYDITDKNNLLNVAYNLNAGRINAAITGTATERKLLIYNNQPLSVGGLKVVTFQNFDPRAFNYLLLSHSSLRKPAGNYPDIVKAYADFRSSPQGGNHRVLLLNMELLYDQFSYGERTAAATRNFARYMYRNGTPEFLFLIGKSYTFPDQYYRSIDPGFVDIRKNPVQAALDLVPSGGWPPSDVVLVNNLDNSGGIWPQIAVGRLGASTPQQVLIYLNKVIEQEAAPNALWQKNLIHLTGGNNQFEQVTFSNYANALKAIAEGNYLGGRVSSSAKRTFSPVEILNISELVNGGVGLVMFFGHSSFNITDLEIGRASDDIQGYRNKGRYPMMLANGCQLGGVFYSNFTLSEDWIYTPDRGCVGFIAHCYFGYSEPLRIYSNRFYRIAFQDLNFIGKPVGKIMQELIKNYVSKTNTFDLTTSQQMILQGDPAIRFFKSSSPDYTIPENKLFIEGFENNRVTAVADSFQLKAVVQNIGIIDGRKIGVSVRRIFADGTSKTYFSPLKYNPVTYQDTLVFVLKKEPDVNNFGNNRFEMTLDFANEIPENNENNNTGAIDFFMPTIGVLPLLPQEYAIVNQQEVLLTAIAGSLNNEQRAFIFEIDTVNTFNSPLKQSNLLPQGSTANWQVNLTAVPDSTVFYWRVNYADAVNNPNTLWGESSFTLIRNSADGWTQRRFPQFAKAKLQKITRNELKKQWEFERLVKRVSVKTFGSTNGGSVVTDVNMSFEGTPIIFNGECGNNVIVAITFDQVSGFPKRILNTNVCGRNPDVANFFDNNSLRANGLGSYLSLVPAGDYVLFFTIGNIEFSTWNNTQRNIFTELGGNPSIFSTLQNGHPFIILGKKGGSSGSAIEVVGSSVTNPTGDAITLEEVIPLKVNAGQIISTRIGPAQKWKNLFHRIRTTPGDTRRLDLYGSGVSGTETLLQSDITLSNFDLGFVDATRYPYLTLKLQLNDDQDQIPAQLQNWLAIYDGVPEGFLNPDIIGREKYLIPKKQEGELVELEFAFQNISNLNYSADSLTVQFTLTNQQTLRQVVKTAKIKAPRPKESVRFKHTVETQGMGGNNSLRVYVNPQLVQESFYENNIYFVNIEVEKDNANPLLEVAFDGRKILDGEIVSPSPLVTIRLRDENRFTDATNNQDNLVVSLKRPCQSCNFENISMTGNNVSLVKNEGNIQADLRLENLTDGIYTLRVQGEDANGNRAGTEPYQVNFEVINASTVTNFFPYPNPFSTSTRFAFTLTGQVIPEEIKIQIMTVSGKVVREITQDEIGTVRIGNNLSEYAWDGRDEFGDRLANGVYLYRAILRINGKPVDPRETAADKGFKNGFGKLYIVR